MRRIALFIVSQLLLHAFAAEENYTRSEEVHFEHANRMGANWPVPHFVDAEFRNYKLVSGSIVFLICTCILGESSPRARSRRSHGPASSGNSRCGRRTLRDGRW